MKQHPPFLTLLLFAFVLITIQACRSKQNFPYEESNAERFIISLERGKKMTESFRRGVTELSGKVTDPNYLRTGFQLPVAVQFNKDVMALLLNQKDSTGNYAEGIRMYFARNDSNQVTLVLVPHDKNNKDILNRLITKDVTFIPGISAAFAQQRNAQVADNALRCPTFCDITSDLSGQIDLLNPGQ
jgi:hypothetical protein